jgi:thioredoxin 1
VKKLGNAITLTDDSFQSEVIESSVPVLVDFWATWCGPCRVVAPIVDELAEEYDGRVKVGKVDVDSEQKIAADFGIRSIPTLLIFKDGKQADQIVGAVPKNDLVKKLESVL